MERFEEEFTALQWWVDNEEKEHEKEDESSESWWVWGKVSLLVSKEKRDERAKESAKRERLERKRSERIERRAMIERELQTRKARIAELEEELKKADVRLNQTTYDDQRMPLPSLSKMPFTGKLF